jgi:excisionase family DNA binding protein
MMNTKEAAKHLQVGKAALMTAIKKNRLPALKIEGRWNFTAHDLDEYKRNRFDRKFSTVNDEPLYDKEKGEYSVLEAAKILPCPRQHLYHACRIKKITCTKKRCAWVIKDEDIIEYRKVMVLGKKKVK